MSLTYSTNSTSDSKQFYTDVALVTDIVLANAKIELGKDVREYQSFLENIDCYENRSFNEYLIEIVMLGVFWLSYENDIKKSSSLNNEFLHKLYLIRKNNKWLKPPIDKIRGVMISSMLYHDTTIGNMDFSRQSLRHLLRWMNATGEFFEEAKRIKKWQLYIENLDEADCMNLLEKAYRFAKWFEITGKNKLGCYTGNVNSFIEKAKTKYQKREDYGLATRKEIEYHFNMVATEVLNRASKERFMNSDRKVVLLPVCMRIQGSGICKGRIDDDGKKCTYCNPGCNVGKVCKELRPSGIDVYLIPHCSGFSRILKGWQKAPDTGLLGVACTLNLLAGIYEAKRLGIPSQCVNLDFCGCKKHWQEGISTSLNIGQLKHILGIDESFRQKEPSELIAVVNENDQILGYGEKKLVHRNKMLHRSFSIMIFNQYGEILIQRRALNLSYSPGLWTNACCSHLIKDSTLEVFTHERLQYEMGFDCDLKFVKKLHYKASLNNAITENEMDYIYCGLYEGKADPNKTEICEWMWCEEEILKNDVRNYPEKYTYRFRNIIENHLDDIKSSMLCPV